MISTRKKLVYGVVLVAASGLFANELVNATRSEPSFTPIERAAEAENESGSIEAGAQGDQAPQMDDPAAQSPDSQPAQATQAKPELGAVLASLEAALERLESAPAGADGRRVDALVRQQRPRTAPEPTHEAPPAAAPSSAPAPVIVAAPPAVDDTAARRREDSERRARLQRFLEESPLSGVVCSADGGVAMFGGRIVRTGESLLGDEGLVNACTPQGVEVLLAGREVWIPMPAVRVRPAASSASNANAGAAAAAPSPAPSTPAPSTPNTTPSAVGNETSKGSQAAAPGDAASGGANRADSERTGGQQ
jgi:hypothetical protein